MNPAAQPPAAEHLSQEDVRHLLAQVAEEDKHTIIRKPGGTRETLPRSNVKAHNFRAPAFLAPRDWRQLHREQESFAESLSRRLSNDLRLGIAAKLSNLATVNCRDFVGGLSEPAHLVLFKVEPLRGVCVLELTPLLGLAMVDRLLGGPGQSSSINRDLSEIEIALLDQVLQVILGQWCQHWAKIQDLRPRILGHETNGRYLQIAPAESLFLVVTLEIRWGDCLEDLRLAFPCQMVEPLMRQLVPPLPTEEPSTAPLPKGPLRWNPGFGSINVPLSAEWPSRQLNAGQVARLRVGDILEWDPAASTQVRIKIAAEPKFLGRLGTRNGRWAVEVTGSYPGTNT